MCGSAAAGLLGLRFRIPPGLWHLSLASIMCCQVEVFATGHSLVQRSPTECGVSECECLSIISKPEKWGGLGALGLSSHDKAVVLYKIYSSRSFDIAIFGTETVVNLVIEGIRLFSPHTPNCTQDSIIILGLKEYSITGLYFKALSCQDES